VRCHLPEHAQDIDREAFNHAFAAHADDPRQEEAAHRIAWAAVKRSYAKVGNPRGPAPGCRLICSSARPGGFSRPRPLAPKQAFEPACDSAESALALGRRAAILLGEGG
jgi:cation transport regulator